MALKIERKVILGHAVASERGTAYGAAGSQNGKELRYQSWYNRSQGWSCVLRAKEEKIRKLLAKHMKAAVDNKHIGYDQNQRTTLYREAMNAGWDISKITTNCETDCSALVSVCINAAGIKVSKDIYTGNMTAAIKATKAFLELTSEKYTDSSENLTVGDILVGKGHTAMVVDVNIEYTFDRALKYVSGALMTGADVSQLQIKLKELGYYTGKLDGIFGGKTEAAVISYQNAKGLKTDGSAGRKTLESLGYKYGG